MNDSFRPFTFTAAFLAAALSAVACGDDTGDAGSGGGDSASSGASTTSSGPSSGSQAQGSGGDTGGPGTGGDTGGPGAGGDASTATGSGGDGSGGDTTGSEAGSGGSIGGSGGAETGAGGGSDLERVGLIIETEAEGEGWADGWDIDNQTPDTGYALDRSSEQARFGESAIRFELHADDPIVSSSVRTEMQPLDDGSSEEMERWYGLSYFLTDWGADDGGESILQWHDTNGTCPPLSLQIYANEIQLTSCIDGGNTYFAIGDVVSNTWMDIVIHVVWRTDDGGVLELWRDGEKLVDAHDLRTQSSGGSYVKVGMNKWSWAPNGGQSSQSERIFFIDELRIGDETSNLVSVSPGDY